jgi:hypothetical protein
MRNAMRVFMISRDVVGLEKIGDSGRRCKVLFPDNRQMVEVSGQISGFDPCPVL